MANFCEDIFLLLLLIITIIANILVLIHHWKMDAMAHLVLIRYNYSCSYTKEKKKGRKYTTRRFLELWWKYIEEDLHSGNLFAERKSTSLLIFPGQHIHDTRNTTMLYPSSKLHRLYRSRYKPRASYTGGSIVSFLSRLYPPLNLLREKDRRFMGVGNPWQDKVTHRLAEEGRTDRRRRRRRS